MSYLYVIVFIILATYFFNKWISYLNYEKRGGRLPEELSDVYSEEEHKRQVAYQEATFKFDLLKSLVSVAVLIVLIFLGFFGWLDGQVQSITQGQIWGTLLFFGILHYGTDVLKIPFSLYGTFVIEEKFGFNKKTPKIYITDKIKNWIISGVLMGAILALITWFYLLSPSMFWVYGTIAVVGFTLFMAMLYTTLIVPLFNKLVPLPEGELRSAIEKFASENGFELKNIYSIDASKRSTKLNAYFSGLGPKKDIVLFDTLIEKLTTEEIVAVLAHEIGHYQMKHVRRRILWGAISAFVLFYVFSLVVTSEALTGSLGMDLSFYAGLFVFSLIISPLSIVTGTVSNIISRKHEFEADSYARDRKQGPFLVSSLKKLNQGNLGNLTPHPWFVFMNYSHPPTVMRVKNIKEN